MMFWKFQSQRVDVPAQQAPAPVFVPATSATEQASAPMPQPATIEPQQNAPVETLLPSGSVPDNYEEATKRTMRFLASGLGIASWVLFKNQNGVLSTVAGVGEYQRYLPASELSIGGLSDLPTINLLRAAPPLIASEGADRRHGGVDPATVAPFGLPLVDAGGNLFGILCALGEGSAAQRVADNRGLLDYAASMLGAVVRTELTLEEATRRTERAQADALVDPLTGLHNRRAWDQLLATEDQRCSRHGYDAVVFVIDLDGLKATNDRYGHERGDELIKNAATVLERCVRRTDVVARVGGDEFSILAVKCDAGAAARIREHIESTLLRANAPATVGFAVRSESGDLFEAWRQADGAMYHRKRGNPRRAQRVTDEPVPEAPIAQPGAEPEPDSSVVTEILEKVLPALVTGVQKPMPPPVPAPPPTPIFTAPAEEPQAEPEPQPQAQPQTEPQPDARPQQSAEGPSEDLIDIVSRLSRLSDTDRRLLDVFFKGSR